VIKYLGSKRKLLDWILSAIGPAEGRSAIDLFSGTARVGHALKGAGFAVLPARGLTLIEVGYPEDALLEARAEQTRARRDRDD